MEYILEEEDVGRIYEQREDTRQGFDRGLKRWHRGMV
jgi:hypothetical protein